MHIEQLYTNCLAEAAYYIESDGEAAIIDPIREITAYLEKIKERGVKLKYVFETHFHADFVSGHIDLARQTGAQIIYGPMADTTYKVYNAKEGEEFSIGKIKIRTLHTPGHTPESSCYLLFDESGKEHCVFTGDTLFVGDVGRPDLLDGKMSKEELAGMMYESLKKLKALPDEVIMYPAHGPGSACGKNIGKETWSTIGQQKSTNYALQEMSKEKFIKLVTAGLSAPPQYFFKDAMINKSGYDNIDEVMKRNMKALSVEDVKKEMASGALVLDTRIPDEFEKGFIKGALSIGLNGQYAVWVGTLVDISQPLVIVAEEGKEEESILRLARVGYENVKGYLKGGIRTWINTGNSVDKVESITPEEFAQRVKANKGKVIDVRKPGEFESGHVKGAKLVTLAELSSSMDKLPENDTCLIHCAGGYRSMIAASMLRAKGITNIVNVYGGYSKIKETGVSLETSVPA
jgi:glyoxylase-like metal-dependent hydrolase (beta-lactamase superfamily II)/rhodanese-related sulfurtransferase